MRYGSVCSGIEAATAAWHPLGWEPAFFSEIEAFPRAVLAHHYPHVPLHGDFTTIGADEYGPIDLLVGGTPCQSFSIAGLRGGLADDRGNLALEFLRLADRTRPRWLVWENVPGVLSSGGGRDFGSILGGLVELGYGFAYRILDAQHFGIPQRRRRVFVVGHSGDWRRAAAVLFERHSLSWNIAPSRQAGPAVAALTATGVGTCGADDNQGQAGHIICLDVVPAMTTRTGTGTGRDGMDEYCVAHSLRGEGFDASEDGTGRGTPLVPVALRIDNDGKPAPVPVKTGFQGDALVTPEMVWPCLSAMGGNNGGGPGAILAQPIAFSAKDHGADAMEDCSPTLRAGGHSKSHANAGVMPAVAYVTGGHDGFLDDSALPRAEDMPAGAVRALRELASRGSPQERRLAGQPARELDAALSKLSHEGASPEDALHHLRGTAEGARLLQQASAALQALGRSPESGDTAQDAMPGVRGDGSREGAVRPPLHASQASAVRRLTPVECERLQGFPDDYTNIPWRGKAQCPDGPRYKALGNSMAVPVMAWIGRRIDQVDHLNPSHDLSHNKPESPRGVSPVFHAQPNSREERA